MKRLSMFLLAVAACMTITLAQTQYSGTLNVKGKGTLAAMINVTQNDVVLHMYDNEDGSKKIELKNFSIVLLGSEFNVGHIIIPNLTATAEGDVTHLKSEPAGTENNIILQNGDDPTVEWIGSGLGGVQGVVEGTLSGNSIEMSIPLVVPIGSMQAELSIKYSGTAKESAGIGNIAADTDEGKATYNMSGQRVERNAKGVIIIDGRKYINK